MLKKQDSSLLSEWQKVHFSTFHKFVKIDAISGYGL